MTRRRAAGAALLLALLALWGGNTSLFTAGDPLGPSLLAHRGVHQTFDVSTVGRDDCTATMIRPPTHGLLENTLPSIEAAFTAGADVVEIDLKEAKGVGGVVFHDWTLDCRTDLTGVTHETRLDVLTLYADIGHGYTADGGATYPFRGRGDRMPTFFDVMNRFDEGRFLVNFKSDMAISGDMIRDLAGPARRWTDLGHRLRGTLGARARRVRRLRLDEPH